ncbi:MAG: O-succinylbenzoic acid--CoA ligase, partial [Muribaculaceae bacterium]
KELTTNDVVELISSTQFRWLGRADHVINSGGVKIHPEQIENIIRRELPQLPPFYLVGKAHPQLGSEVVMVIECGAEDAEIAMHQIAGLKLPRYSHPRQAIAIEVLPRTSNGKVRRLLSPDNQ